jgi:glucosamine 6-phosphate synthetase-like amidotransferase/phosphosugar isomerase protein
MAHATGIDNGNSKHAQQAREYLFELPPLPNQITINAPVMDTIKALAEKFFDEQQRGLMVMRGGLKVKGERIATEAELKLTGLAYLAEQLANGASLTELARTS